MSIANTNPKVDTIIRGGKVVTSSQVIDAAVAITGEKIVALAPEELASRLTRN